MPEQIGPWIIGILILILIGVLVSLVTLVPSIWGGFQHRLVARIAAICILGLVSFVISFGLFTRLEAEAAYVFGTMVHVDTFDPERPPPKITSPPEAKANKPHIVRELWIRLLVPPAMRRSCYAGEPWICELTDDVTPAAWVERGWGRYLLDIGVGCVSLVTSSVLVWLFTRTKRSAARTA